MEKCAQIKDKSFKVINCGIYSALQNTYITCTETPKYRTHKGSANIVSSIEAKCVDTKKALLKR